MSSQTLTFIKGLSIVLISGVLGLELWNLWSQSPLPQSLQFFLKVGHVVIPIHALEGVIAALKAPNQGESAFRYSLYTFFVGFPGLWELFRPVESQS